jgi:hypothetical protein
VEIQTAHMRPRTRTMSRWVLLIAAAAILGGGGWWIRTHQPVRPAQVPIPTVRIVQTAVPPPPPVATVIKTRLPRVIDYGTWCLYILDGTGMVAVPKEGSRRCVVR